VELSFLNTTNSEFFIQKTPALVFDKQIHWNFVRLTATLLYSIGIFFYKNKPIQQKLIQKRLSGAIYSEHTLETIDEDYIVT